MTPSDAYDGNFLEAINTTMNILDKHYMDRDLLRTGNSIVMISAGVGVFKVKPTLSQITKQRMMDTGIGIDFISLSQPPLHTVPLFHVDCSQDQTTDFYEHPHWINISFVDCERDSR
jgi:DEP domain-containing protein 5